MNGLGDFNQESIKCAASIHPLLIPTGEYVRLFQQGFSLPGLALSFTGRNVAGDGNCALYSAEVHGVEDCKESHIPTGFTTVNTAVDFEAEIESESDVDDEMDSLLRSKASEYTLTKEMLRSSKKGVQKVMEKLKLSLLTSSESFNLTGSKVLKEKSLKSYHQHFQGLCYFCCLVEDWESFLCLQDDAPKKNCPNISAETVSWYLKWKY